MHTLPLLSPDAAARLRAEFEAARASPMAQHFSEPNNVDRRGVNGAPSGFVLPELGLDGVAHALAARVVPRPLRAPRVRVARRALSSRA